MGILNSLKYQLANKKVPGATLSIDICIDGLPISKSSNIGFWPILGLLRRSDLKLPPFVIGIFYGESKPDNNNEFLGNLVRDIKSVTSSIQKINDNFFSIKIRGFQCDAPALAFIKGIKNHNGYYGCGKCVQEGDFINNRICFPEMSNGLRTDEGFKLKLQVEHHKTESILEQLDIGMVSQFPLDYLHLVLLGVAKKLIHLWLNGPLNVRLTKQNIEKINIELAIFERNRPKEIVRQIRKIESYKMWKATEFRTFLLYTGSVVLQNAVKDSVYKNFNILSAAIRILCDNEKCIQFNSIASELLKDFVIGFKQIYGASYISYNVHNLLHLSADVLVFGPLDDFSTFMFESFMYQIKKMIRKGNCQLQQVVNRLQEKQNFLFCHSETNTNYPHITKKDKNTQRYFKIAFSDFTLTNKIRNQWFFTKEKKVYIFLHAIRSHNAISICCKQVLNIGNFQPFPFESSKVNLFKAETLVTGNLVTLASKDIAGKLFCSEFRAYLYFISLIHTNKI